MVIWLSSTRTRFVVCLAALVTDADTKEDQVSVGRKGSQDPQLERLHRSLLRTQIITLCLLVFLARMLGFLFFFLFNRTLAQSVGQVACQDSLI
jgi:hypothetical protein